MIPRWCAGPRPFSKPVSASLFWWCSALVALSDGRRGARGDAKGGMSRQEAFDVLGPEPGADEEAILAAHKRLLGLVHPDRSGSAYLIRKVHQAGDALLGPSRVASGVRGDFRPQEPASEALVVVPIAGTDNERV